MAVDGEITNPDEGSTPKLGSNGKGGRRDVRIALGSSEPDEHGRFPIRTAEVTVGFFLKQDSYDKVYFSSGGEGATDGKPDGAGGNQVQGSVVPRPRRFTWKEQDGL